MSSILASHVELRLRCVDRVGVAGYIPDLVYEGGLVKFLLHRASLIGKANIPSPALLSKNHDRMLADFDHFVAESGLSVVRFHRGESKELLARPHQLAADAEGRTGVVLVGKAQERIKAWAGYKDSSDLATAGHPHFSFTRQSRVPDSWYFYLWDNDWGPAFIKLCPYAPYLLWVMANGHEWAKRQLTAQEIEFSELDNGLWRVGNPEAARRICASLGAGHLRSLIDRWLPSLPSPLIPADRRAGFSWSFSVRQLELSDTAVFDRPQAGRAWFEAAIRDHLDLGRPDNVSIVFDRNIRLHGKRPTPGRFATGVVTKGAQPQIQVRYKSSKAKAYFKEQRALRVETTINDSTDFDLKKTLNAENWRALRRTGDQINARFLEALGEHEPDLPDAATLEAVVLPSVHNGQRAPGLRFGDPRITTLFGALCSFDHIWSGLNNRSLRALMQEHFDPSYTPQRATYDLRRLRLKGFIERIAGTHRYRVTLYGRRIATFFTRLVTRVVVPALTELDALSRPPRRAPAPIATAWRAYDKEVRSLLQNSALAA
ncbi:MAG: hypothetical protein ACRDYB_12910 [Acidimicrobiales bacterium]